MILSLSAAAELKKAVAEKFSVNVHFHDGCGGQYFSLQKPQDEIREFISNFLASKNFKAVFSENGEHFTVERVQ